MHWDHEQDQIRTAGGPRPQRSRKDESVGDFPGVLARATRCDRGPVAVRYFAPATKRSVHGESLLSLCARIGTMNLTTRWERGCVSRSTQGFSTRMDFPERDLV